MAEHGYNTHGGTNKISREWTDHCQYTHECRQKYDPKKKTDTSKDELLLGGGICHLAAMSQYHAYSKQVLACLNNIVETQYFVCL